MKFKIKVIPYELEFKRPAKTSRGVYHSHKVWYVVVYSPSAPAHWGIGECAPLVDLSCDYHADYEQTLYQFCGRVQASGHLRDVDLRAYPSMLFGLETAFRHFERRSFSLWDTPFSRGEQGIPINGLIWMGGLAYMREQIEAKLRAGFRCVKLKIGSLHFDEELQLLEHIRSRYTAEQVTLRVDANGAFSVQEAPKRLQQLAALNLHSIEQPVRAGQWDAMAKLARETPLPIALDEELIGIHDLQEKKRLLQTIKPQYIILKPSLHGGISGSQEWINLAQNLGIGWWLTSALESNIGLNAIAQWCGSLGDGLPDILPQGLGTGGLYTNNIELPLDVRGDCLWFDPQITFHAVEELIKT